MSPRLADLGRGGEGAGGGDDKVFKRAGAHLQHTLARTASRTRAAFPGLLHHRHVEEDARLARLVIGAKRAAATQARP